MFRHRACSHADCAAVEFEDLLDDRQAQSGMIPLAPPAPVDPVETVEDARQFFPGDAATRIAHGDDHVGGTGLRRTCTVPPDGV